MSLRGRGRGRSRPRGGGARKTEIWQWEDYTPGPEVYSSLFRVRNAPPTITQNLPNDCPLDSKDPGAQSKIVGRIQAEDAVKRLHYRVLVRIPTVKEEEATDEDDEDDEDGEESGKEQTWREVVVEVDMSRILEFVSPRELERFETNEFKLEAEADAAAKREEAEEKAMKRLERNARMPGIGRGSRILSGLRLDEEGTAMTRGQGRPSGRGRGRGRWRGRGRGGMVGGRVVTMEDVPEEKIVHEDAIDVQMPDGEILEPTTPETEDEEGEEEAEEVHTSPVMRSSFVANSALPVSPILTHRSHPELPVVDDKEASDDSMSSAAAQLISERRRHERPLSGSEDASESEERGRPPVKRQRTKSISPTRNPPAIQRNIPTIWKSPVEPHIATYAQPKHLSLSLSKEEDSVPTIPILSPTSQATHYSSTPKGHQPDMEEEEEDEKPPAEEEEFAVEAILSHMYRDGVKLYLVKWEGYDNATDWISRHDLEGAPELVAEYNKKIRKLKRKGHVQ